jgi:RecB family exonuclease
VLEILRIGGPEEKRRLFSQADPVNGTWVVSDLQSKWHLQKEFIKAEGVLEQTAVLRAQELWQRLCFQAAPQLQPLTMELAQTLFWDWIQEKELPWARSPRAVSVVLNQMQMWMSIFSDPNYEDIMSQWFTDNQEAYVKWGHWFELCSEIWRRCQEKDYVMTAWLPAVLLSQDLSRLQWRKQLTFDLGSQISQVEGQLIKELSRHMDVRVLYPEAPWLGLMKNTLRPYEPLLDEATRIDENWQPQVEEHIAFGRFSTQLAEVKDAVAQVRGWLESGVEPRNIALVAPDIEEYWPALRLYLKEEGIPAGKASVAKIGGFLETAQWMASLRTAMARVSANDLEVSLFAGREKPRLSFDDFKVLFSKVYDAGDLKRAAGLFKSENPPPADQPLDARDFLAWSLKFWDASAPQDRLEQILQTIGKEVPPSLTLKPAQWLSYSEGILARREITLERADENGVWCVSLTSSDWLPVTHSVFLNLNEGALRKVMNSPVSSSEAQKIFTDTGYAVGTNDRQEMEFEFLWFLQKKWTALRLCFSSTDFQGSVLTPSKLWLWASFNAGQLKKDPEAPRTTRWDELQSKPIPELGHERGLSAARAEALQTALARDVDISVNSWGPSPPERLSASALESYFRCPFIYASQRRLKLSDEPALDLDLDRRTRGKLLHALADRLGAEPFRADWSDGELLALIEAMREKEKIVLGEERLWPAIRAQHLRLARQFLVFESDWRARFPTVKTVARELDFDTDWNGVKMTGRIDRVDADAEGRYGLVDYKASAGSVRNWSAWMKNHDLQLGLYSILLEEGKTPLPPGLVVSANYYVIKDKERRKGFHQKTEGLEFYAEEDKHRNLVGEMEKMGLYEAIRQDIDRAVSAIGEGRLNPAPEKFSICDDCTWRTLCRAPHLN